MGLNTATLVALELEKMRPALKSEGFDIWEAKPNEHSLPPAGTTVFTQYDSNGTPLRQVAFFVVPLGKDRPTFAVTLTDNDRAMLPDVLSHKVTKAIHDLKEFMAGAPC